jgi:hypothetical protein
MNRWLLCIAAASLLFWTPVGIAQYAEAPPDGVEESGAAATEPSVAVKLDYTADAPVLTKEIEELMARCNPNTFAPATPVSAEPVPDLEATMPPSEVFDTEAAGDFEILRNQDLGSGAPSAYTSSINEPSLANNGGLVFYSGNWYASISTNNGSSWLFVNPFTKFPSVDGGFCCDQDVVFAPNHGGGMMIWLLMYSPTSSGNNRYRIAVARGAGALRAGSWIYYDFRAQNIGQPAGQWYDYPKMALSNGFLWIGTNMFNAAGSWTGTAMLKIPLSGLASGGSFTYYYYKTTSRFNFTPVDGATTTMYWASHNSTSSLRIYTWTDASTSVSYVDKSHTAYSATTRGTAICGPVGSNWCGRYDDRVLAGYVAGGVIGFGWNVRQGGSYPWPYVRWIRLNQSTKAVINQPVVYSTTLPWAYPSVGVNSRGHLGGTIFYGVPGAPSKPGGAAWIADDYNGGVLAPLTNRVLINSTHAPLKGSKPTERWGDYVRTRPHTTHPTTWIGTIFSQQGGGTDSYARPRFVWFGRERDVCVVYSTFETTLAPWTLSTNGTGSLALVTTGCGGTGKKARVYVATTGSYRYFQTTGIRLAGRQQYKLTFYAYNNRGHDMRVSVVKSSSPGTSYGLAPTTVALGTSCVKYTYYLTPPFDGQVTDAMIRFDMSPYDAAGDYYYFDQICLMPNVPVTLAAGPEGAPEPAEGALPEEPPADLRVAEVPEEFFLADAYPNPFNPSTTIEYGLPEAARVRVTVFDMLGRSVRTLEDVDVPEGYYRTEWDGTTASGVAAASGVYYYRIDAVATSGKQFTMLKKMMFLK